MQPEATSSFYPYLYQRLASIVWSYLDADLTRSAVFYAERYYAMERTNHDACHLYAIALFREGQTYSAMHLVTNVNDVNCSGCLEIKAKCLSALGRHREARDALEQVLQDANYTPTASQSSRTARPFPEEAAIRCRSGRMAWKGNLPEQASTSFRQALALNPMLWEAFEGLCALGSVPSVDEIFPPRPPPIKRGPPDDVPMKTVPVATGAGFFTPDLGNARNLLPTWKNDSQLLQGLRMGAPLNHRENLYPIYPPNSAEINIQGTRPSRQQGQNQVPAAPVSRPLSSADEAGPVAKRLRSTVRQRGLELAAKLSKPTKLNAEDALKKIISKTAANKTNKQQPNSATAPPRRSTRLQYGASSKQGPATKHPPTRERRKPTPKARSKSIESEADDDAFHSADLDHSPSPPPNAHSPGSAGTPTSSTWTVAHEQAAQEEYEQELADEYLYEMTRRFASATRALSMYDCRKCLDELEELPDCHQHSAWVLAMVGRAHYERLEYAAAERAFQAVRGLDPYRLWDMEIYSTLLWHLQRSVQLSFLAQELLNIDPQSPQAWIAVGNLFSLQKERSQALTCFRRAIQLDSTCAYAYTLSGHESIDEDLDRAIGFFQTALRADTRHYNAWYGLGTCYLRMSKVRLAEYHYRKAAEINPKNAVLLGCVGMAVERRGDQEAALALFNEAVRLSPDNALGRYRRAKVLIAMKRYKLAIEDLENLRNSSPEESNVVFQLAKVYRLVGDEVRAAQLLAVARDISPKSLSKIKKLLETMKDEEVDHERMDEG